MGGVWDALGPLLGALGALFERSWGAIQVGETLSHTSKRSGRLLDAILSRFSLDFERVGSDLSSIFRGFSCFLLLSLAVSCFLLLSLACCCLLLLSLACSCFLLIHKDSSCAFCSIATQVSGRHGFLYRPSRGTTLTVFHYLCVSMSASNPFCLAW